MGNIKFDLAIFEAFMEHDDDGTLAVSNVFRLGSRSLFGFEYDSGYNIFDDMYDNTIYVNILFFKFGYNWVS